MFSLFSKINKKYVRSFSAVFTKTAPNAYEIYKKSCYNKVDFIIHEDRPVQEAIVRFSVLNISSLAVIDDNKKLSGVMSKRDYINKVAIYNKTHENIKVKDIFTYGNNVILAKKTDTLEMCMHKMLFKNIHHLLIVDDQDKNFIGMISMKDIIHEFMKDKEETITRLTDFNLGKGAFFGSE